MEYLKKIVIFALIGLLLVSCKNSVNISKENDFGYFDSMNLETTTISAYQHIAPSEDGIYFTLGNYIYYFDFDTKKIVFLCNKPNCKHNKEKNQRIAQECNAYLQNASYGGIIFDTPIIFNRGFIYMIQSSVDLQTGNQDGYDIIKIGQDGSNREIIIHSDNYINNIFVHFGKLYYVSENMIYNVDLNNNKVIEFSNENFEFQEVDSIYFRDDFMYISSRIFKDLINNSSKHGIILRVNLNTKKYDIIKENLSNTYFNLVNENTIIFTKDYDSYLYFIDDKKEQYLCDESGVVHVMDNYIYIDNGPNSYVSGQNNIIVFDKNYRLIDTILLDEGMKHCTAGAYNDQIFILYDDLIDNSISRIYTYYVKNKKISKEIFYQIDKTETAVGYQWNIHDY